MAETFLSKKVAGQPVGLWLGVAVAGIGLAYFMNRSLAGGGGGDDTAYVPEDDGTAEPTVIERVGGGYVYLNPAPAQASPTPSDTPRRDTPAQPAKPAQPPPTVIPQPKPGTPIVTQPKAEQPYDTAHPGTGTTPRDENDKKIEPPPKKDDSPAAPRPVYPGVDAGQAVTADWVRSQRTSINLWAGDVRGTLKRSNRNPDSFNATSSRNIFAIGIQGTSTPWWGREELTDVRLEWNQAAVNRKRLSRGLFPLTAAEFQQAHNDMAVIAQATAQGRREANQQEVTAYAKRWNEPYDAYLGAYSRRE